MYAGEEHPDVVEAFFFFLKILTILKTLRFWAPILIFFLVKGCLDSWS